MSLPSEKQQCRHMYWDKWLLAFGLKAKETAGRCGECRGRGVLSHVPIPTDYCQKECGPS